MCAISNLEIDGGPGYDLGYETNGRTEPRTADVTSAVLLDYIDLSQIPNRGNYRYYERLRHVAEIELAMAQFVPGRFPLPIHKVDWKHEGF